MFPGDRLNSAVVAGASLMSSRVTVQGSALAACTRAVRTYASNKSSKPELLIVVDPPGGRTDAIPAKRSSLGAITHLVHQRTNERRKPFVRVRGNSYRMDRLRRRHVSARRLRK